MAEPTQPAQQPTFDSGQLSDASHNFAQPDSTHQANGWQIQEVPTSGNFNWLFNNISTWVAWLKQFVLLSPGAQADTVLTVAAGAATPTQGNHVMDGAGPQTLNNIVTTNLNDGRLLILSGNNPAANLITLTNAAGGAGQMHFYDGNPVELAVGLFVTLKRSGPDWFEMSRTLTGSRRLTIITATTTYTPKSSTVRVRAWGGGGSGGSGGGGGGAAGNTNAGQAGGTGLGATPTFLGIFGSQYARAGLSGLGGNGGLANVSGNNNAMGGSSAPTLNPNVTASIMQSGAGESSVRAGTQGGSVAPTSGVGGGGANSDAALAIPFQNQTTLALGGSGGASVGNGTGNSGNVGTASNATFPGGAGAGGGGGSAGNNGASQPGNGGAGGGAGSPGEYAEWLQAVVPGVSLTATIGSGGLGNTSGGAGGAGTNGGGAGAEGGSGSNGFMIIEE